MEKETQDQIQYLARSPQQGEAVELAEQAAGIRAMLEVLGVAAHGVPVQAVQAGQVTRLLYHQAKGVLVVQAEHRILVLMERAEAAGLLP